MNFTTSSFTGGPIARLIDGVIDWAVELIEGRER
jgi:hypothetical protein